MSMNKVKLSQIVRDFIVTLDGDDFVSNASDAAIRNFATPTTLKQLQEFLGTF